MANAESPPGTQDGFDREETVRQSPLVPGSSPRWYTRFARALVAGVRKIAARFGPRGALIVILLFGLSVAVALSGATVWVYDSVAESDGVAGLDRPLLGYALTWRSPWADAIITGYTVIAGPVSMPIIAIGTLIILAIYRRSFTPVIVIAAAGLGSLFMTIAGKDLIKRVRPPLSEAVAPYEYSPSFPSGHALNAVVIAGIIAYLLTLRQQSRRARVFLIIGTAVFAFTIGLSRVFLGHHWFTDVLAGWMLGSAWLALVVIAHRLYLSVQVSRLKGST